MSLVSVIIPLYNEEALVDLLIDRLQAVADATSYRFEFILVDDGSRDHTVPVLLARQQTDSRLVVVQLSRNWGHQNAYNAGLDVAKGNAVIFMDGDLEDPPELIPQLLEKWDEGYQVVSTVKKSRVQKGLRRWLTRIYYAQLRFLTNTGLENQSGMFSLVDQKVAEWLRALPERNKSYPNLRAFVGFKQCSVSFDRGERAAGEPRQTLRKLFFDGFNGLFSFSFVPIRIISVVGMLLTLLFVLIGAVVLFVKLTGVEFWYFKSIPGTTMAVLLILTIASFQIIFMGILGEYIARIYDEVRQRPYYIIKTIHRHDEKTKKNEAVPENRTVS